MWYSSLIFNQHDVIFDNYLFYHGTLPFYKKMSDEWAKYRKILEREDEEFKKTMEAEVSILLCPRFNSKCRVLVGIDIITHFQWILQFSSDA